MNTLAKRLLVDTALDGFGKNLDQQAGDEHELYARSKRSTRYTRLVSFKSCKEADDWLDAAISEAKAAHPEWEIDVDVPADGEY
jgi:hypothetical protein